MTKYIEIFKVRLGCGVFSCHPMFFSYHYKLPVDVYAYMFDMCTNKVYLLAYLLTLMCVYFTILPGAYN